MKTLFNLLPPHRKQPPTTTPLVLDTLLSIDSNTTSSFMDHCTMTDDGRVDSVLRLDKLPPEIVGLIATLSDASTILDLSQTCRSIRTAVYDATVIRNLINLNQSTLWKSDSLDSDALSTRAGSDPQIWARFALADQRAWELHLKEGSTLVSDDIERWLPEIAVLKRGSLSIAHPGIVIAHHLNRSFASAPKME